MCRGYQLTFFYAVFLGGTVLFLLLGDPLDTFVKVVLVGSALLGLLAFC
jgi:hypothetical protein